MSSTNRNQNELMMMIMMMINIGQPNPKLILYPKNWSECLNENRDKEKDLSGKRGYLLCFDFTRQLIKERKKKLPTGIIHSFIQPYFPIHSSSLVVWLFLRMNDHRCHYRLMMIMVMMMMMMISFKDTLNNVIYPK